ncbi:MAG TPA: HAD-IIB family hydrolase [Caulobacteraceae bacterium]|nr:HAD-IIB family hydrolase [Caulobacteraceae bacterium]
MQNGAPIRALATDYDGTLASHGEVADATLAALERLKASGRQLIMVTGRELPDLRRVFGHLALFDAVVAENGALLWRPASGEERQLAAAAPAALVQALRAAGVQPLAVGRSIVATADEYAPIVEQAIRDLGLDWRTILNKDSVMSLPAGVDKASGLAAALDALGLAAAAVLGVGDAENDSAFLVECGVSAAVANALPDLKAAVDIVAPEPEGAGVAWLIDRLLADLDAFADLAHRGRASVRSA